MAKTVLIRAYDAKAIAPQNLDEVLLPILAAQNSLWNELVQTEHAMRARAQIALESVRPDIQALRVQIEQLQGTSSTDDAIEKQLSSLRRLLKSSSAAARRAAGGQLHAIEEQRKALVKQAVKRTELWWCHSEGVTVKYERARLRAIKEGRSLNFHKFSGLDSLRVRLGHGGLPISDIYARKTSMLHIEDPTEHELGRRMLQKKDGGRRAAVTVRIGAKEGNHVPTARLLVTIQQGHEPPAHIPLKMVSLRREVTLSRVHWKISLTFSGALQQEDSSTAPGAEAFAEIGLTSVSGATTRGLRVGVIQGALASAQPIVLPAQWIVRMRRIQALMSDLDAEAAREWLLLAKKCAYQHEPEEWFRKLTKRMLGARVPKHRALIAFAEAHTRAGSPFGDRVGQDLQQLAEHIRKKGQPIYDMRKRAIEHRNSLYRNFAATIARSTNYLRIIYFQEKMSSQVKERETEERAEFRNLSRLAATSVLKKFVEQACSREGVRVEV